MTNDGTVTKHPLLSSDVVLPSVVNLDGPTETMVVSDKGQQTQSSNQQIKLPLAGHLTYVSPVRPILAAAAKPNVVHQKRPSHSPANKQPQNINILICPTPCNGRCAGNCPQECCQAQTNVQQGSTVVCQRPCINNCTASCPPACCSLTQSQVASAEKSPTHTFSYYGNAPPSYLQSTQSQPANVPCQGSANCLNTGNANQGIVVSQGHFVIHPNGQVTGSKKEMGQHRGAGFKIQIISPYYHLKKKINVEKVQMKKHYLPHVSRTDLGRSGRNTSKKDKHSSINLEGKSAMKTSRRNHVFRAGHANINDNKLFSRSSKKRKSTIKGRKALKGPMKRKLVNVRRDKVSKKKVSLNYKSVERHRRSCECQTICKKSGIANSQGDGCITNCNGCPIGYQTHRKKNGLVHKEDDEDSKEQSVVDNVADNADDEEELVDYVNEDDNEETGSKKSDTAHKEVGKKEDNRKDNAGRISKFDKVATGTKKEEIEGIKDKNASKDSISDEEEEIEDVPDNEEEGEEIVRDEEENVELMNSELKDKLGKKRKDEIDSYANDKNEKLIKHKTITTEDEFGNKEIVESEIVDPNDASDDERISEGEKRMEKSSASAKEILPSDNSTVHYNFTNGDDGEEKVELVDGDDVVNEEKSDEFVNEVNKNYGKKKAADNNEDSDRLMKKKNEDELANKNTNEDAKKVEENKAGITVKDAEMKKESGENDKEVKNKSEKSLGFDSEEQGNGEKTKSNNENIKQKVNEEVKDNSSVTDSKHDSVNVDEVKSVDAKTKSLQESDNDKKNHEKNIGESSNGGRKEEEKASAHESNAVKPTVLSINVEGAKPVNMDEVLQRPSEADKEVKEDTAKVHSEDQPTKAEERKQVASGLSDEDQSHSSSDKSKDESVLEGSKPKMEEKEKSSSGTRTASSNEDAKSKMEDENAKANENDKSPPTIYDEQQSKGNLSETRSKSTGDPYAEIGTSDVGADYMKKFAKKEDGSSHNVEDSLRGDKNRKAEGLKENKTMISDSSTSSNEEHSSLKEDMEKPSSILENFKHGVDVSDTGFFMDSQTGPKSANERSGVGDEKSSKRYGKVTSDAINERDSDKEKTASSQEIAQYQGNEESQFGYGSGAYLLQNGRLGNKNSATEKIEQGALEKQSEKKGLENQGNVLEPQSNLKNDNGRIDSQYSKRPGQEIKGEADAEGNVQDNNVLVDNVKPTEPINLYNFKSESKTAVNNVSQNDPKNRKPTASISLSEFQTEEKRPVEVTFHETYDDSENDNKVESDSKEKDKSTNNDSVMNNITGNSTDLASKNMSDNTTEGTTQNKADTNPATKNSESTLSQQAFVNDSKPIKNIKISADNEAEKYESDSSRKNDNLNAKNDNKSLNDNGKNLFSGSGNRADKSEDAYKEIASGNSNGEENSLNFTPVNVYSDVDKNGDLVEVEKDDPNGSIVTMTVDEGGNGEDDEGGETERVEESDTKHNLREGEGNKELGNSGGVSKNTTSSSLSDDIDNNQDIDAGKEALEAYNSEHSENEEMSLDALAKILDDLDKSVDSIKVKNSTVRHEVTEKVGNETKETKVKEGVSEGQKHGGNEKDIEKHGEKEHLENNKNVSEKAMGNQKNKEVTGKQSNSTKQETNDRLKDKKHQSFSGAGSINSTTNGAARKVHPKKLGALKSHGKDEGDANEIHEAASGSSDIITDADGGGNEDEAVEVVEPNNVLLFTKNADSRTGDWFEKVVKPQKNHKMTKKKKHHAKSYEMEDWNDDVNDDDLLNRYEDEDGNEREDGGHRDEYYDEDSKRAKDNFVAQVSNFDSTMSMDQLKEIDKAIIKDDYSQFDHRGGNIGADLFDLPDEQDDVSNQVKVSSKNTMQKIADALNAENKLEDQNSFPDDVVSTKFFSHETPGNEIDQYAKGVDDMSSDSVGTPLKTLDPLYEKDLRFNSELTRKPVEETTGDIKHNIPQDIPSTKSIEGEKINGPDSSFDGGDEFLNPEPHISKSETAKARHGIFPMRKSESKEKEAKSARDGKNMLHVLVKGSGAKKLQQKSVSNKKPGDIKKKIPKKDKSILKNVLTKKQPISKKATGKTQPVKVSVKKKSKNVLAKRQPVPIKGPADKQSIRASKSPPSARLRESGSKLARLVQQVLKPKSSQPISKAHKIQKLNDSLSLIDEMESQIDKELQKNDNPVINEMENTPTEGSQSSNKASIFGSGVGETSPSMLGLSVSPTEQITLKSLLPEYGTESPGMKVSYVNEQPKNENSIKFPNPQEEQYKQASQVLRDMNTKDHHARLKQAKVLLQMQKYEADNALNSVKDIQSKAMDEILKASMERQKAFVDKIANKYEKDYYSPKPSVEDSPLDEEEGNLQRAEGDSDLGVEGPTLASGRIVKFFSDDPLSNLDTSEKDIGDSAHAIIVQKDGITDNDGESSTDSEDGLEERDLQEKDGDNEDDRRIREMTDENEDDDSESEESSNNDSNTGNDVDNNDEDDVDDNDEDNGDDDD